MDKGPLFAPLVQYLDDKVGGLGADPDHSVRVLYNKNTLTWRIAVGYFDTLDQAEAWKAAIAKFPKAHGQRFDDTVVSQRSASYTVLSGCARSASSRCDGCETFLPGLARAVPMMIPCELRVRRSDVWSSIT